MLLNSVEFASRPPQLESKTRADGLVQITVCDNITQCDSDEEERWTADMYVTVVPNTPNIHVRILANRDAWVAKVKAAVLNEKRVISSDDRISALEAQAADMDIFVTDILYEQDLNTLELDGGDN